MNQSQGLCAGLTLAKTQLLHLSFRNILLSFNSLSAETTQVTKPQLEFSRERYVRFQKKHVTNLACYHFLVTLAKIKSMGRNTSISLGNHFESFIEKTVNNGRFNNASEVVRAGLRLLEDEENRIISLRQAIQEGIDSGVAEDFEPKAFLKSLKARNK